MCISFYIFNTIIPFSPFPTCSSNFAYGLRTKVLAYSTGLVISIVKSVLYIFRLVLRDAGKFGDLFSWLLWCLAVTGTIYSYMFHER